jgi:hypothetical protein
MKAEIIYLTPAYAKELLEKNINNRRVKRGALDSYIRQMKEGEWKENGEPIIIDKKGFVKDGQHRLQAAIAANFSYQCPLISDIEPDVMDTIDTGTNRTLGDVLELNGFPLSSLLAAVVKAIFVVNKNNTITNGGGSKTTSISNVAGLEYAIKNKKKVLNLARAAQAVYYKSDMKLIPPSEIGGYLYMLEGLTPSKKAIEFMTGLVSGNLGEVSCTYYGYKKLLNAKMSKARLNPTYRQNLIIKLWSIFQDDLPIKRLNVEIDKLYPLPIDENEKK